VMTKRSQNRTALPTPSEAAPQSGIPSQTKATPANEKPSTMSPGRRQKVSAPFKFSIDTGHRYLTTWLSGRLEGLLSNDRLVHASYPFMIITYYSSQKKTAAKPTATGQPPKTTPHTEAGPTPVPDETTAEPSGAQNNVEARVCFVRFAAGTHNASCSQVNRLRPPRAQKLFPPMFPTKRKLSLLVRKTT
jgi:hypothetical protein